MTAEPNPKPDESVEGKRRRLTLMESYDPELSAFSNSKLSEISNAIRTISTPHQSPSPLDESSGDSLGETSDETLDESSGDSLGAALGDLNSEPNSEISGIPRGQIVRPLFAAPSESPLGELPGSPSELPGQSSGVSPDQSSHGETPDELIILTSNQALLYECTKILDGRFTTLARVSQVVNISVDTLRSCLRKLRKIGVVSWSVENLSGQNGMRISATEIPYTVRGSRSALDEKLTNLDHTKLALNSNPNQVIHQANHQVIHQANHQVIHQVNHHSSHQTSYSSSSSKTKKLLQELEISLLLEGHFQELNVRSLESHLDQFDSVDAVQLFLDMANASIDAAAKSAKPIKNPQGFLFAQLRAGYINPPPGFKSRRVLAKEAMNAQLQAELAELQRLREQEAELRFELFKAGLSDEQRSELEAEAVKRVKPRSPVGRERQIEVNRDEVLREWFEQRS